MLFPVFLLMMTIAIVANRLLYKEVTEKFGLLREKEGGGIIQKNDFLRTLMPLVRCLHRFFLALF